MVEAAGALTPAGAYGVNAGMARTRQSRAHAIAGVATAPAGAKAPAAATSAAAAATWPDFSDGNLGPDSTDDKGVLAGPGTPRDQNHTFLSPIGSPPNHFSNPSWAYTQNFGADLAR